MVAYRVVIYKLVGTDDNLDPIYENFQYGIFWNKETAKIAGDTYMDYVYDREGHAAWMTTSYDLEKI